MSPRLVPSLISTLLLLAACRDTSTGTSKTAGSKGGEDAAAACSAGDSEAGQTLIRELRSERLAGASLVDHQRLLADACEAGCGVACFEHARNDEGDVGRSNQRRACELQVSEACELTAELGDQLCAGGEVLACSAQLAVAEGEGARETARERLLAAASQGCEANDARSCSLRAWTRCASLGECDAEAMATADKAVTLAPTSALVEARAIVQCHAGAPDKADAGLAEACEAGVAGSCDRRCDQIADKLVLFRTSERDRVARVLLLVALQIDAPDTWLPVISSMTQDELQEFEAILEVFTPPITEPGSTVQVPDELRAEHPLLVEAILRSPQLDAKKIQYWFGRLAKMDEEQRANLFESLRKQWWVIPGEDSQTPEGYIDVVRARKAGHAS